MIGQSATVTVGARDRTPAVSFSRAEPMRAAPPEAGASTTAELPSAQAEPQRSRRVKLQALFRQKLEATSERLAEKYLGLLALRASSVSESLAGVPRRIHKAGNQAQLVLELIDDARAGSYRELPWHTLLIASAAALYALSPADLIPDAIPVLGVLDDALVLAVATRVVREDLRRYCRFKGYTEADFF